MKLIGSIFSKLFLGILIVAVLVLVVPRFFGVQMFNVVSASMSPTYNVGDLVFAFPTEKEDIKIGDPITFVLGESLKVATHRVIDIDIENYAYYTQGDANEKPDGAPVIYENVQGVVRFHIPMVGNALEFASTPYGRFILIICVSVLVLVIILFNILFGRKKKDNKPELNPVLINDKLGNPIDLDTAQQNSEKSVLTDEAEGYNLRKSSNKPYVHNPVTVPIQEFGISDNKKRIKKMPPPGWGSGKGQAIWK